MEHVICKIDREAAWISLNRPEVHNAFNEVMIAELTRVFEDVSANDKIRVIVLRGEGKSFCAGADLNWMGKMKGFSEEQNAEDSRKLAEMYHTINSVPKVVIGKVHGAAIGGGVGLAAVCDYVVAQEDVKFGLSEVQLGLVPAVISPFVVAKMGESNARAWFLSGSRFSARRARHMGLVHDVVADHYGLKLQVERVVLEYLRAGPEAVAEAKQLIADVQKLKGDREALIEHTSGVIARLRVGTEGQEGIDALLSRKKPSWNRDY